MDFIVFLFGLAIGSFLNVLIDRLPRGENVLTGRSRCDHCKRALRWFELVPLLSFILQRGRCRRCDKRLSWQYPLIELIAGIGFVFIFQGRADQAGHGLALIGHLLIFSALLVIFVSDLKEQIIPDSMVILGLIGAVAVIRDAGVLWGNTIAGAAAVTFFLFLWIVTRGKGMGLGDVKLAFFMGIILGYPNIIVASYLAFLTGALAGVILILLRIKKLKGHIAFGPFLVMGTVIAYYYGERLIAWWIRLL